MMSFPGVNSTLEVLKVLWSSTEKIGRLGNWGNSKSGWYIINNYTHVTGINGPLSGKWGPTVIPGKDTFEGSGVVSR